MGPEAAEGLIYQAGMSSAVWEIGSEAICKVKTWAEGMESETGTYLPYLRRVQGQNLAKAWPSLTSEQRAQVAATVAQYCHDLAEVTSGNLQSATGCGVLEPFLTVDAEASHPSWKPQPLGPLSRTVAERYLQKISTQACPPVGERFHLYHADLSPTNILLSSDSSIEAILDWKSAGFYPKFWILKPYRSGGFNLDIPGDSRYDWRDVFVSKLSDEGFTLDHGHVGWQKTLNFTFFNINEHYDATPTGT